jgi:integration host factor subunit beta
MTRSELVLKLAQSYPHLHPGDFERILDRLFGEIAGALAKGDRIELRGFGAFTVRRHKPRIGRNPATGIAVNVPEKYVTNFKPGKGIQDRLNERARG